MRKSLTKKISSNLKFVYSGNNSISVVFENNDLLMGVVGEFNSNLKELEKLTNTNIYFRGNSILIKNNTGKNELVKVVCGAPNAREGMLGIFAPVGSYIPGLQLKLKKTKIRYGKKN